jgi:uncharacterized protein YbjT (DUF2867 family)
VVAADLESRLALEHASRGVDAVVLTLPLDWTRDTILRWTENAARAAREGGARLMVMNLSTRLPAEVTDVPSFELRREAEAVARELGPPSIVLRPPFFMENLASAWMAGAIMNDHVVAYPLPSTLCVTWLAVADLGAYVAAALRRPELAGRTLHIGGPQTLDGPGLAAELSAALDLPVRYSALAPDVFERGLSTQLGPAVARGIARGYYWIADNADAGLYTGTDRGLERALARPAMSVAAWARSQTWPARPSTSAPPG